MFLQCGNFNLSLEYPLIMGIVNVTPDSFFDGGRLVSHQAAFDRALQLMDEGAHILDVGGESTRPGASLVSGDEEMRRILPLVESLSNRNIPVSVDTHKPEVMRAAIKAGASMINDINAMQTEGALEIVASSSVAVCLMHKQGDPQTMQTDPQYRDVVAEVMDFLKARVEIALEAGITRNRLVIDPGFGFGKNFDHNVELLHRMDHFKELGIPLLAGLSRKSMLGKITGRDVADRLAASITAAVLAVLKGAKIIRVHDVKATKDAFAVIQAIGEAR